MRTILIKLSQEALDSCNKQINWSVRIVIRDDMVRDCIEPPYTFTPLDRKYYYYLRNQNDTNDLKASWSSNNFGLNLSLSWLSKSFISITLYYHFDTYELYHLLFMRNKPFSSNLNCHSHVLFNAIIDPFFSKIGIIFKLKFIKIGF